MLKQTKENSLIALSAIFTACLIASNLLGSRLLEVAGFSVSLGLFIFPFTFLSADIITELHGKNTALKVVRIGMLLQIMVLAFVGLGFLLPTSSHLETDSAYHTLFGLTGRMVLASLVAYLISQTLDVYLFSGLKKRNYAILVRTNFSIWVSQLVDTIIFSLIFLGGVLPWDAWLRTTAVSYCAKVIVSTFDSPIVAWGAGFFSKGESSQAKIEAVAVSTPIFKKGNHLEEFLWRAVRSKVCDGVVIAITSKVVSVAEGRFTPKSDANKDQLVQTEAERVICRTSVGIALTIKHGIVIPSAGIDESNSQDGDYLLFPTDPYLSAERLCRFLRKRSGISRLGVLITDSNVTPLRKGVSGIALSHWGFKATRNLVGTNDLFGRKLKMTSVNLADALAVSAVLVMGEAADRCPVAIVSGPSLEFTDHSSSEEIRMPIGEDLYGPMLS